jgi:hypothetical protein
MTQADIFKIRKTAHSAEMAIIDVYKTLPENLQDDETFEYFYLYLVQSLSTSLTNWKSVDLKKRKEEE